MLGIILIIILIIIAIFMYLVIVGANLLKSEEEREFEDREQMEYLKNYHKNKNHKQILTKGGYIVENIKIIYGNEDLRELITKMIKDIFMSEIKKGIN